MLKSHVSRISPGGYIDVWRAMQQFEGRSAATVLRDDAQRSRVEAHAVQLNLAGNGGWQGTVVVVSKRGTEMEVVVSNFWEWFLFEKFILNHNLWNHLKPNSQWFAIRYNTQWHRISRSEKMPSCKIFVSDLGPKIWKVKAAVDFR